MATVGFKPFPSFFGNFMEECGMFLKIPEVIAKNVTFAENLPPELKIK
ncbi:hypothetical protein HYU16_01635 [Candidatus Woesearchaeota archaeon]|nr:hypothetical protein [Candidatus Woesearchaeota archaeon]